MSQVVTGSAQPTVVTITGNVDAIVTQTSRSIAYLYKSSTGDSTVLTVPASHEYRIKYLSIQGGSTNGITLIKFAGTTIMGMVNVGAGTEAQRELNFGDGYFALTAAQTIVINCSVSPAIYVTVIYEDVTV